MSLQSILNKQSISELKKIDQIIKNSDSFEANQMQCYTIQAMCNSLIHLDCMCDKQKLNFENCLIEYFTNIGWISVDFKIDYESINNTILNKIRSAFKMDSFSFYYLLTDFRDDNKINMLALDNKLSIKFDNFTIYATKNTLTIYVLDAVIEQIKI